MKGFPSPGKPTRQPASRIETAHGSRLCEPGRQQQRAAAARTHGRLQSSERSAETPSPCPALPRDSHVGAPDRGDCPSRRHACSTHLSAYIHLPIPPHRTHFAVEIRGVAWRIHDSLAYSPPSARRGAPTCRVNQRTNMAPSTMTPSSPSVATPTSTRPAASLYGATVVVVAAAAEVVC